MTFKRASYYIGLEIRLWRDHPVIPAGLAILALARIVFVLYGYGALDQGSSCAMQDRKQTTFEGWVYQRAMGLTFPSGSARHVALVTMTEGVEPLDVMNNTCANRSFLASLVPELVRLKATVTAIDQSYSERSCNIEPTNERFRASLQAAGEPVIVGQRVHNRADTVRGGDCLVEEPMFNFGRTASGTGSTPVDGVKSGLLRLNSDVRKIPLFWWAFPSNAQTEDQPLAPSQEDGFAYRAALAFSKDGVRNDRKLQAFFLRNEHPYASLVSKFPTWSAMDVLCYGPSKIAAGHPEWGDCDNVPHVPFHLTGKVVVVGDHIDSDRKSLGSEQRYGMDLHAGYIEAILSKQYMGTAPLSFDLFMTVLFIISIVGCEAVTVREWDGKVALDATEYAVALCMLMAGWALCVGLIWRFWHLVMPNFLLAITSMALSLVGVLLFALFVGWARRYPLMRTEDK